MDTTEIVIAALGIALGGFLKGATGAGAPVVGVPVLAMALGVQQAVAIFAVLNLLSNIWQSWDYRASLGPRPFLWRFAIGGAIGASAGTFLLASLPTDVLMGGLSTLVFLYIALRLSRPGWRIPRERAQPLAFPVGLIGGVMQGAGGISAPVSVTFLNALRFERAEFVATISMFFLMMSVLQIPTLISLGVLTWDRAGLTLIAVIPLFGAMPLGETAARRISKDTFDKVVLVLLAVVATKLMYSALA